MELNSRKEKILQAVVDTYITNCEPISSVQIKDNYLPALSSATIRNELAALEELGYLTQPHISSGRIPTAQGYKMYVQKLMPKKKLTREELDIIKRYFNSQMLELDDILKNTAKVITEITNLTSVAYAQNFNDAIIQNIKIVKITEASALIIVVTDLGMLKNFTINIESNITDDYCTKASNFISSVFNSYKISQLSNPELIMIKVRKEYQKLFNTILKMLKDYQGDEFLSDFVLEGNSKILDHKEYENVEKAKAMLQFLDAKHEIVPLLNSNGNVDINIQIGRDNEIKQGMPECAIVTASYNIKGHNIGSAGVVGPIRMDYAKVVSVLDYVTKIINHLPMSLNAASDVNEDEKH